MARYLTAATAAAVTDGGATETVVLTLSPPQFAGTIGQGIYIGGSLVITSASAGTTAIVVKCRRGTTTSGTAVGATLTITATTSTKYPVAFDFFDESGGESPTSSYVITVTETSASANGTVQQVTARAEALSTE